MADKEKESKKETAKEVSEKSAKKSGFGIWAFLILLALGFGAYSGYKYISEITEGLKEGQAPEVSAKIEGPKPDQETDEPVVEEQEAVAETQPENTSENAPSAPAPIGDIQAKQSSQTELIKNSQQRSDQSIFDSEQFDEIWRAVNQISDKNEKLQLYSAALGFRSALNSGSDLLQPLNVLSAAAENFPNLDGKIDLLQHSIEGGLKNIEQLKSELGNIEIQKNEAESQDISANIENVLNDLVRVTKVKGDENSLEEADLIRAAKYSLSEGNLQRAINLAGRLGDTSKDWVKDANNLLRAKEISEKILNFAGNNLN